MANLPDIITAGIAILSFLGTIFGVIFTLRSAVSGVKDDLKEIKQELKQIVNLTIIQTQHAERLTAVQQTQVNQGARLDELTRRVNTYLDMERVDQIERKG